MHSIRVFNLLQPLAGDIRSNDVTSLSLPVTWDDMTSFPITWKPPASGRIVGNEKYSIREFSAFYSHFQVTSGQMTSFRVTIGHLRSRDVIRCHVTASSCELQPCRKLNVQYMPFSTFYSHFQVTSGQMTSFLGQFLSPEVMWRHLLSHDCLLLRATALYEVKCSVCVFSAFNRHFQVTSGQTTSLPSHFRSPDVTWRHFVTWRSPASYSLVGSKMYSIRQVSVFHSNFQVTSDQMTSLPVTWGNVTSFHVTWLTPASYSLVGSEMYRICKISAFYSNFQVTSG